MKAVKNAVTGIIVGVLLIIVGTVLLIFNEGNNVKNIKTVEEARKELVNAKASPIDVNNEGALVGVNGTLTYLDNYLLDNEFYVSSNTKTVKMVRTVEMYQWDEESDTTDDKTTYSYKKVWKGSLISSKSFHESGHENPSVMPYENLVVYADNVKLGDFNISRDNLEKLTTDKDVQIQNASLPSGYTTSNNYITNSRDYSNPEVGDIRIKYSLVSTDEFSIVAMQQGSNLVDYTSSQNKKVHLVSSGIVSGTELINKLEANNNTLKWVLRVLGIALVCFGFASLLSPITQVLNIIPLVGKSISGLLTLMGLMIGFAYSMIVIAVSWIAYRPVLGCALLAIAAGFIIGFSVLFKKCKNKTPEVSGDNNVGVTNKEPINITNQEMINQQVSPNVEPLNNQGMINNQSIPVNNSQGQMVNNQSAPVNNFNQQGINNQGVSQNNGFNIPNVNQDNQGVDNNNQG